MSRILLQQATITLALTLWLTCLLTLSGFFYSTYKLNHFAYQSQGQQTAQLSTPKNLGV